MLKNRDRFFFFNIYIGTFIYDMPIQIIIGKTRPAYDSVPLIRKRIDTVQNESDRRSAIRSGVRRARKRKTESDRRKYEAGGHRAGGRRREL